MCSTDIAPTRLAAAEAAALSFIRRQPASTQIGIVAFAGFAELVQAPTNDQELLETAVESLLPARRTAVGNGILKSLDAIAEIDASIPPTVTGATGEPEPTPVPKGVYAPHIIVLLTDGATNAGPQPLEAAEQAAARGIRVYTIGFGTERGGRFGGSAGCASDLFGGGGFGFGGGGGGFRRGIDEETLKEISAMTDGEYYEATSADELQDVFNDLPTYLIARHELMEVSVLFTALGALLAALAVGLALLWNPLP
jgi:Ca-activated chloride channel family protein